MVSTEEFDLIVVGGGIIGLAVARAALADSARVLVLEADSMSQGASIRNFGMLWPIGQPSGMPRALALRSCQLWQQVATHASIPLQQCGSLHLAHHEDEWRVLQEFASLADSAELELQLLDPQETMLRTPCANPEGLQGALWSRWECRVDPRVAVRQVAAWLQTQGATIHFQTMVTGIEGNRVMASDGRHWAAPRILVCSGAQWMSLYPQHHRQAGLKRCKLHMLRSLAPERFALGPHLASGLTLRHYSSFAACPSLESLKSRVQAMTPELDQHGIHVMISQAANGHLVLGDSHHYDDQISPFEDDLIDGLILREIHKVYRLPSHQITQRWTGVYAKHPKHPWIHQRVTPQVEILNGFGGSGMTLSMAAGEHAWQFKP
jgi:FAD dependent oxidoreductase TIGR03364